MTERSGTGRSAGAALAETLDAHGAAVCAYAQAVAPGAAREVAIAAVAAARVQLPAAGKAAGSPAVAWAAVLHNLRVEAARAVAPPPPSPCAGVPGAVARLANGELSAEDEAKLRGHVASCDECEELAQRFTTGERLLAAPAVGAVPLWLYEAAAGDGGGAARAGGGLTAVTAGLGALTGRRPALGAGAGAGDGAAPADTPAAAGGRRSLVAGLAALVVLFGVAIAAASVFDGGSAERGAPTPAATPPPRPSPSPTSSAGAAAELTREERAAERAAARDREINLAREGRALTRERRAARRASAARRRRAEARRRAAAAPSPTPTPTPPPEPEEPEEPEEPDEPEPAPAPTAAPYVPPAVVRPAPPRPTPRPDPPGRVPPS